MSTPIGRFTVREPYRSRPIRGHGLRDMNGWRMKCYSIRYGDAALDWPFFEPGFATAAAALAQPAVTAHRPGVGFVIAHQGRSVSYLVTGCWGNENELVLRVHVRGAGDPAWRPAQGDESVCVWDLQVIGFERDAYVATVMREGGPEVEGYLARFLSEG